MNTVRLSLILTCLGAGATGGWVVGCSSDDSNMNMPDGSMMNPDTGGPTCPNGFSPCSGSCADFNRDPSNCGTCGHACTTANAEVCVMGQCQLSCGGGTSKCAIDGGFGCFDFAHDINNCGGCGMGCMPGFRCTAPEGGANGTCTLSCVNGQTVCNTVSGDTCVDLQRSDQHCGKCNSPCDPGFKCDMGTCTISCQAGLDVCPTDAGDRCTDLRLDPSNCGKCGTQCPNGQFCSPQGDAGVCSLQCFGGTVKCGNKCA